MFNRRMIRRYAHATILVFCVFGGQAVSAQTCSIDAPRYHLLGDSVGWSMEVASGRNCVGGVRIADVVFESMELISPPRVGQITLHGPGFNYTAKADFQGEDSFTLVISGSINKRQGSSTVHVAVVIGSPPGNAASAGSVCRSPARASLPEPAQGQSAINNGLPLTVGTPRQLPQGVTLQQIDGGPTYYADHGFTYAVNAGWDNPSFFPIGLWVAPMVSQSDANRWLDLCINTAFTVTGNSNLSLLRSNGISLLGTVEEFNSGADYGSETVGLLGTDENWLSSYKLVGSTANSVQDHRFWWLQSDWHISAGRAINTAPVDGTMSMSQIMALAMPTPNGTTRHFEVMSADIYWEISAHESTHGVGDILSIGGQIYRLGRNMTSDEALRPAHYGDQVDLYRSFQSTYTGPILQFVENGEPGNAGSDLDYITPSEMNAAVWASIIHGARGIIYFNHTFCGSHQSHDNLARPFYRTVQPGQTISIYNQVKTTNALVRSLAPVINSPFAVGYVFVSPAATDFTGFDVMAKWYNNSQFYIFAMPRYSESLTNQTATFTIKNTGATQVSVVNENRTIPLTNGGTQFADTFATGTTVHIYRVS
jgi:hypothetical protein